MNLERMVGGIPEGKILQLYVGDYFNRFEQIWLPVHSPNPKYGSFNQIRLEYRKGNQLMQIAYSKTGNCVMIIKKSRSSRPAIHAREGHDYYTISRTLVPIEDPGGIEKAKKVIEKFLA